MKKFDIERLGTALIIGVTVAFASMVTILVFALLWHLSPLMAVIIGIVLMIASFIAYGYVDIF